MTEHDASLAWSEMQVLTRKRQDTLRGVFGGLAPALARVSLKFLQDLKVKEDIAQKAIARLKEFDPAAEDARLRREGIRFLTLQDPDYPSALREMGDPPVFLYTKGDLSILAQPCIALVGTRKMTEYGARVTEEFVGPLVRAGMVTVSGLACGIDTRVALETLRAGGRTVAVLGHGLGTIFPAENRPLAERIVQGGGLLLTEYPYAKRAEVHTFPARNRIVAGLSLGVVVLEAPAKSGALITADLGLDYGREVFAVPGPIFEESMEGCHALIAKGAARLVTSAQDILRECGLESSAEEPSAFQPSSPQEDRLWKALTRMPQPVDRLVELSGVPVSALTATLTLLELQGAARNAGGGQWVRA